MNVSLSELWYRICQSLDHPSSYSQQLPTHRRRGIWLKPLPATTPTQKDAHTMDATMPKMLALQRDSPSLELYGKDGYCVSQRPAHPTATHAAPAVLKSLQNKVEMDERLC